MRALVPQIMTILLLVHLAFGCCWHHAHFCRTDAPSTDARSCACVVHEESARSWGHDNLDQDNDRTHERPPTRGHHNCEGTKCTFLRSERPRFDVGRFASLAYAQKTVRFMAVFKKAEAGSDRSQEAEFAGLRVHLCCGVLLI